MPKLKPNMTKYDYKHNGADWKYLIADEAAGEVNYCKTDTLNQSPVNLLKPSGSYGWAYGAPVPKEHDSVFKQYENIKKDVHLTWVGDTMKVKVHPSEKPKNYFTSKVAKELFGAVGDKFEIAQFHFHSPSEHTINGEHFDVEIHFVHTLKLNATVDEDGNPIDPGKLKYAVIGLLFDEHRFDKRITAAGNQTVQRFFDTLNLDDLS